MSRKADWPDNCCREEACERDDLHEAHEPVALKGRTPRSCPSCLRSLASPFGCPCGWTRDGLVSSASPWVLCPKCPVTAPARPGCDDCAGVGVVPRLRFAALRRGVS